MSYNWQQEDWLHFTYDLSEMEEALHAFAEETGKISGLLKGLSPAHQTEAILNSMVAEAIKTSEIEGEYFSRSDVMSSIKNKLGLNMPTEPVKDKKANAVGELMVLVRNTYSDKLTEETLFLWHELLMKQYPKIKKGKWRTHRSPMQVVSGAVGREKVYFEAPPSARVPIEMDLFIKWFNDTAPGGNKEIKKAPVRAAIAHLYFETIHPFEDGNGRIGRAIAEKALSQTLGRPVILSLSETIERNKKQYYSALKEGQRSNHITLFIHYFINTTLAAQISASERIAFTLKKTKFLDRLKEQLNQRQLKAINKMLDAEPIGFKGGMTAAKYMSINNTSKATATRDLQDLIFLKALVLKGAGRNTHYYLNLEDGE